MGVSLFNHLNKDKKRRQRATTVLCLILVVSSLLVFYHMKKVGVAMTDGTCCGLTEHTHDKDCGAEKILICKDKDHKHTDDCYKTVWSCGLEEHRHNSECYPDHTADVESPETWEASLPELSGYPISDLVSIAESQKGYTESSRNVEIVKLDNDSQEMHGYTRYGVFVDLPYCDNWSAAFVSFCLHYSGLTESDAPRDADCETMRQLWEDAGIFSGTDAHNAQAGDLVFIDRDGNGEADSVGIVSFANAEYISVIEGNSNEKVEENEIALSDGTILGYGLTAVGDASSENDEPDAAETSPENDKPIDNALPYNPSNETSGSSWISAGKKGAKKASKAKAPSGPRKSAPAGDVALDSYITDVSGAGTVKIDDTHYMTMVELSFSLEPSTAYDVTSSGHKFIFNLPEEILIPEDIVTGGPHHAYKINSYPLELAFTYEFIPNGDGTYRIEIVYDDTFVEDAVISGSDIIDNILRFRCYIVASGNGDHNNLEVEFTADKTLTIPSDEIYEDYDVSTRKTGSFTSDGKLRYEVTVSSVNGTPDDIEITDTFTYSGNGTVSPPTSVSVVKHNADGSIDVFDVPAQGHLVTPVQNEYDLSLTLPQLDDNEYYTLVYDYSVTGLTHAEDVVSAYNRVDVDSDDGHDYTSDTAEYFIYNQERNKLGKDGIPYGDYVQWHISVNDRGSDIAGKVIYDDGFAEARNETINGTNGIFVQKGWTTATPGVDYEFVYENGEIVGIRFLPADASTPNTNTYHITYYSYPDVAYGEDAIEHNEAEFDGDNVSYDVVVEGGDFDKTENGDQDIGNGLHNMNWTVSVKVPMGGIESGTVFTDTLTPDGHYMTQAQYNSLVTALQAAWGLPVTVSPINTGDKITGYTFSVGTQGNGYLLNDGYTDEISWQYQTTGDLSDKPTETFINTFTDGEKTLPVGNTISPHVKKLNVRKVNDWQTIFTEDPTSLAFDYEDEDKTFVWVAQVTAMPGLLQYRVTDLLPEGVELIGVKVMPSPLTAYNYSINDYTNNLLNIAADGTMTGEIGQLYFSKATATGSLTTNPDGRQLVDITLTGNSSSCELFQSSFNVIYYCQLSEDAWPQNGTVRLNLNNTVDVTTNGDEYGEADNTIIIDATHTQKIVDKSGVWDRDTHFITYTVDINPTADNLFTSSGGTIDPEWLMFKDELSYMSRQGTGTGEAILNLNSVVLEKEENGVWTTIPNIQWEARTENDPDNLNGKIAIIEMKIPDSTHLRLTYSYHVNSSMSDGITLNNSAKVEGHAEDAGDTSTELLLEDFDTSGESTFKEYRLIKIDEEDGRPLEGAVFTVYSWDAVNHEWVATAKSYTTDQDGKIVIKVTDEFFNGTKVYSKDTAYCIMETAAPIGYILPANPRPFYFWFSENEDAPLNGPDDFMLTAADVSTSSHRIEAENQCENDYVVDTGVYGVNLLSSFGVLFIAGVGTFLIALMIVKKKYSTYS